MKKTAAIKALTDIPVLKAEINRLTHKIASAYDRADGGVCRYGVICARGGKPSDPVSDAAVEIAELKRRRAATLRTLARRYQVLDNIPDSLIRDAVIRHYLKNETWAEIAAENGLSGGALSLRVRRYLAGQENAVTESGVSETDSDPQASMNTYL